MMLKKSKRQIADDAQAKAFGALSSYMGGIGHNLADTSPSSLLYKLQNAIGFAIGEAVKEVLDNVYTDQEFERDTTIDRP